MEVYKGRMKKDATKNLTNAWTSLIRAQHAALSHVESNLKKVGLPPLVWYDVLLELSREPIIGLRSVQIEQRMLLPQYGISRLLDRTEKAGYIRREDCADDGRGRQVFITDAGCTLLAQMWPIYRSSLEQAIGSKVSEQELKVLHQLLDRL